MSAPLDPFTCPICDSCDHDLRTGLLEFMSNVQANLKDAGELILDAIEVDGEGVREFAVAIDQLQSVNTQLGALLEFTQEVAILKGVAAQ